MKLEVSQKTRVSPYQIPQLPLVTAVSLLSELNELFSDIVKKLGGTLEYPLVTVSENLGHGDFASNIALRLTKQLKKSPMDIALQVKDILEINKTSRVPDIQHQMTSNDNLNDTSKTEKKYLLQDYLEVEIAAPGFVNLSLNDFALSTRVDRLIESEEAVLTIQNPEGAGKRVVLEFTDPNPFKELHIGHLYSNSVGESIARLLTTSQFVVRRVCYQGDVGLHVAKAIWGMQKLLSEEGLEKPLNNFGEKLKEKEIESLSERAKWLGSAYALGASAYEDDGEVAQSIKDMNYAVFVAAQDYITEQNNWKHVTDYQQYIRGSSIDISLIKLLYATGRKWSLDYFDSIYKRLGMSFAGFYFESIAGEYGTKLVQEHTPDVFTLHEGAILFQGEIYGLHTRVFINTLGLPTYEAKELGLAPTKQSDWPYDYSLILTGKEIDEYFEVLLTVMSLIHPELAKKTKHLSHGMVRLPEGKMSSRTGNVLTGEWLIEEIKRHLYNKIQNNISKYDDKHINDTLNIKQYYKESNSLDVIAEKTAIAAIKYSLLKVGLPADITFDIQASISFEGESGPYLQYTYARCKSVLRKQEILIESDSIQNNKVEILNSEERVLVLYILQFSDIVVEATNNLSPNVLCTYLFRLAQSFNLFYAKHTIVENEFRLSLTKVTARILSKGLYLLGIEVMEKM